jgi:hypothetical protein
LASRKASKSFKNSGRTPQNLSFKYNGSEIEVVKNFNYLGIIFSKTGNFNLAKKRLVDKSFKNKENKNGDKFSPCLIPLSHAK